VTGAVIGGFALAFQPALQDSFPALAGIANLAIGAAAIGLGRNPNGIAGFLFNIGRKVTGRRGAPAEPIAEQQPDVTLPAPEEVGLVGTP
jgi:branched-chain amino acid transport system permease protein